ncbi:MAG: beta-ketoacyl-ACP synthase II [Planctomycetes bacterium]|nr:beta-ketoacyl-ACP synthase II [Planctomycetota bacterium]
MSESTKRRVVVTGLGAVAPNGVGVAAFWQATLEARSGISAITAFDASPFDSRIAGQVKGLDPLAFLPPQVARKVDRFVHLGIGAASEALKDSGLDLEREDRTRVGCILGSGLGGLLFHEEQIVVGYGKGLPRLNPLCVSRITPNAVASHVAIHYGLLGPNLVISTACASGTHGIGESFRKVQHGEADVMVTGGAEAPLTPFNFGAYAAMKVLSKRNDAPEKASRPFDRGRDGFVLSEGGASLILEELDHARRRGARVYAELIGYSATSGAHHMVIPEPTGSDAALAMRLALADARIGPADVGYINAHGTSTHANDVAETKAIKDVFGDHARRVPISATKSVTGHSLGAAGAIEAVACVLTIDRGLIHPTANLDDPDPECDLDYVPRVAREAKVDIVLSNSFGFGNANACLVFARFAP